jgi:hypothetical protein
VSGESLLWIDWRLGRANAARDSILRFIFLALAAFGFLLLLLSGVADRFLASRYEITAVLRAAVPPAEGEGLAAKVAALPPVRSAVYKDPEAAWKEFLAAYPGLDSLRSAGGNPLPGYIEIRLRPDHFTGEDVERVTSALRSVSHVEKVLAGEGRLPRLLQAKRCLAALAWGAFAAFAAVFLAILVLQERYRAAVLAPDIAFLGERGIPAGRIAVSRAAGGALVAALLAAAGILLSGGVLRFLLLRYPVLEQLVGPPGEIPVVRNLWAAAGFILGSAVLAGGSSLIGSRAARARR